MKKTLSTVMINFALLTTCLGQGIPPDKFGHFSVGYVIGATTTSLFEEKVGKHKAIVIGCGASVIAGVAKELIYDNLLNRGETETDDVAATILGGITGSIVITINF